MHWNAKVVVPLSNLCVSMLWIVTDAILVVVSQLDSVSMIFSRKEVCKDATQIWTGLHDSLRSTSKIPVPQAVVYTPYNILPGGGERVLLSAAAVFQALKYHAVILTTKENTCKTKSMLLDVAQALDVPLADQMLTYKRMPNIRQYILENRTPIEVFLLIGNEKLPQLPGVGKVNLYVCQFPFDLDRKITKSTLSHFTTFDHVIVYSKYVYRYYNIYAHNAFRQAWDRNLLTPLVSQIYPPVARSLSYLQRRSLAHRRDIAMIGRIFEGRQNKGYKSALLMFQQASRCIPSNVTLHIVGSLMPGHEEFYQELLNTVKHLEINVQFHLSSPRTEIFDTLSLSLVQWHLTGIDTVGDDPASEEHFGIAVVEGMQAGVIPVVINKGGLGEIVRNGTSGYIAGSQAEVVSLTCAIYRKSESEVFKLRKQATRSARAFSDERFKDSLRILVERAFYSKPFRHLVNRASPIFHSSITDLPKHTDRIALIVEDRQHFAFSFVVKNALYHLGHDWGLVVVHTRTNDAYVHHVLKSVSNVAFIRLEVDFFSPSMLNQYMKRTSTWTFDAWRVLVFQSDSLLLHGNITKFLRYDFIGAPWHLRNKGWSRLRQSIPSGVGNGGVSLRSLSAMREISRVYGNSSPALENEDIFFTKHMQKRGAFRLPSRKIAYDFALEVPCVDLEQTKTEASAGRLSRYEPGPLALHAAWYYMSKAPYFGRLLQYLESSLCSSL